MEEDLGSVCWLGERGLCLEREIVMPYQEKPDRIDETIAIECCNPTWVRCSCGNRLCYVNSAVAASITFYCWKCKKYILAHLGYDLELE